jgi:type I restriction enzyme S subunit
MKKGWQTKTLGEICDIERGGSPRPIQEFITTDPNGINWIKIGDATASGKYIYRTEEKIKPEGAKRSRMVYEGDFILSNSMSFGRPYIMKTTGCIHDGWLVLHQPKVDPDYLYHALSSDLVFDQFDRLAAGSTVRNLNIGLAKSVEIPYPPLEEQRRIVVLLDEALEGLATVKANAEKNLQSARALFESRLQSTFDALWQTSKLVTLADLATDITDGDHLPPPKSKAGVPFITISNIVKESRQINFDDTFLVPRDYFDALKPNKKPRGGDVLYTVTGSFGIPVLIDGEREFCFQRHIGLIRPKPETESKWLYYLMLSPQVFRQADVGAVGAAQRTVSLKLLRSFEVPMVETTRQREVVGELVALSEQTQRLTTVYKSKLHLLDGLKRSLLHQAFAGELLTKRRQPASRSILTATPPVGVSVISKTDLHAGILAMAYQLHETHGKVRQFTHVKAEKIGHMVEATAGLDLDRAPVKDAAGPNDFPHLLRVEHRARRANFFDFKRGQSGSAYRVQKLSGFNRLLEKTREVLGENLYKVEETLSWMLQLNVQQAEIVATGYAAWNNLLLDGKSPSDDEIVYESRDNWHPNKLKIERQRFLNAVHWLRKEGVVPQGIGKRVSSKSTP